MGLYEPLRRSSSRRASKAICSNVTEQPSPFGDCAANPTDGSPSPSSAKWRTKLQWTPSAEAWNANAGPDPRDAEPNRVPVDDDGVAVVGHVPRHDRDHHRLTLRRVLEAELRPAAVVRVQHEHTGVEGPGEVDRDACAEEIVIARIAHECRRVQRRLRAPLRVDEPVRTRPGGDQQRRSVRNAPALAAPPATAAASARRRWSRARHRTRGERYRDPTRALRPTRRCRGRR